MERYSVIDFAAKAAKEDDMRFYEVGSVNSKGVNDGAHCAP